MNWTSKEQFTVGYKMMMAFNDGGIAALIYISAVVVSKTIQFTAFQRR